MVIHEIVKYNLEVFWDDEFKRLDYIQEPFNDSVSVNLWLTQGYQSKIVGAMCDIRHTQPSWNHRFVEHFERLGWKDVGTSYYCMSTGTVMPVHSDLYKKYIERFDTLKNSPKITEKDLSKWSLPKFIKFSSLRF